MALGDPGWVPGLIRDGRHRAPQQDVVYTIERCCTCCKSAANALSQVVTVGTYLRPPIAEASGQRMRRGVASGDRGAAPRPNPNWALNDRIRQEGTTNLLKACRDTGVRRYVQQSIAFVVGGTSDLIDETAPCCPPAKQRHRRSTWNGWSPRRVSTGSYRLEPHRFRDGARPRHLSRHARRHAPRVRAREGAEQRAGRRHRWRR